jgi:hypothetical protein
MSTWMIIGTVWMMFAFCVVLFVRGASSRMDDMDDVREDAVPARAEASRIKI